MDTRTPIACSLSAGGTKQRLAQMAEVGATSLRTVEGTPDRPVLSFAADETTKERIEAIVAAESSCCAFLEFDLQHDADRLRLTITGPEQASPLLEDMVAAFKGTAA